MPDEKIGSASHGRGTLWANVEPKGRLPVHPRTGGELAGDARSWCPHIDTVHPRTGGEHNPQEHRFAARSRFIPARAGNTTPPLRAARSVHRTGGEHPTKGTRPVHPRTGGEHNPVITDAESYAGHPRTGGLGFAHRFIPARAGNTIQLAPRPHDYRGQVGSSPHGRGTRAGGRFRTIDGLAVHPRTGGEHMRLRTSPTRPRSAVHPRTGGEHVSGLAAISLRLVGSSPHGRGTRDLEDRR